ALCKFIGVRILVETEVMKGEVMKIKVDTAFAKEGGKAERGVGETRRLIMCTTDMETVSNIRTKMIDALLKENVTTGDIISINKASRNDYDAAGSGVRFAQSPEGEIQKQKEVAHNVSLNAIDIINSRQQDFLALFMGDRGKIKPECFSFINHMLESDIAPVIAIATNRGIAKIRRIEYKSPHGIPPDLLDCLMIASTEPYRRKDGLQYA
ncbi:hypothetical protein ACHAWF_005584, partial [Thalassiosira exigua]